MEKRLIIILILLLSKLAFGQRAEDIAAARMMYSIFSMPATDGTFAESVKPNSKIPSNSRVNQAEIETCITSFTSQLAAQLDSHSPNVTINNQKEAQYFQIKITAPLSSCPNSNDITFSGNWASVSNEASVSILTKDTERINQLNRDPVLFRNLEYVVPIDYKEGDSKPMKINGTLTVTIPTQLNVITLTSKDINKEIMLGETTLKLLELKGNSYKMQWSEVNPMIKVIAVNSKDAEFSMNMGRNFPTFYYDEFAKKVSLTDADFARIAKSYKKDDKRITRLSTVSGTVDKIYVYYAQIITERKVNIDLSIQP